MIFISKYLECLSNQQQLDFEPFRLLGVVGYHVGLIVITL